MKRIESACLEQTILFEVKDEYETYKATLKRKHIKHEIYDEQTRSDGSVVIKIRRQYNSYDCSGYINC